MNNEGQPSRIEWRVVDSKTGTEVIRRLDHPHGSSGTVRALLAGYPGGTALGDCEIMLHPPGSDEWSRARSQYRLLVKGQKLEGYVGGDKTPRYSYVISGEIEKTFDAWKIPAIDTLSWLDKSHMIPGEILASPLTGVLPTTGLDIVRHLSNLLEIVWDDDFSGYGGGAGPHPSTDYTQTGWSFTAADPYEGLPAITTAVTGSECVITTNTSWSQIGQYAFAELRIQGTMKGGTGTDPGEMDIVFLSDSNFQNGLLLRADMNVTAGLYQIAADANQRTAGAFTGIGGPAVVFDNVRVGFPFDITVPLFMNAGKFTAGIWVNGKDSGVYVSPGSWPASGRIGLRYFASTGGAPQIYVNKLQFLARPWRSIWGTARFADGIQSASPASGAIPQELTTSGQSHLDLMLMAAATDGYVLRKTPGRGYRADQLDYALAPGLDLTDSVVLREGVNVVRATASRVAESYGDGVTMLAIPGNDSGGRIRMMPLGAAGDLVIDDRVSDVGQPGYRFLKRWARLVQQRKADPLQAVELEVQRTAKLADTFREGDTVLVDLPSLDLVGREMIVVGYSWSEVTGRMVVTLNDFPRSAIVPGARLVGPLNNLALTYKTR